MIITKPSKSKLMHFSERLPLILPVKDEKTWLDPKAEEKELLNLISHNPDIEFEMYSISSRINSLNENDAGLTKPTPPADQFGNLSLFD
ncbi:MAG: SOS response-associated peptidase [Flammeovirgaceae bacterium]|nr:SOS response-associated peptidase [Flammeovirgaceae bacterium]